MWRTAKRRVLFYFLPWFGEREEIDRRLPENFGALVERLGSFRELVKETLPKQKEREEVFSRIFFSALEEGEVKEEMVRALIQDYARMNTRDNR